MRPRFLVLLAALLWLLSAHALPAQQPRRAKTPTRPAAVGSKAAGKQPAHPANRPAAPRRAADSLAAADRAYREKSHAAALEQYRAALQARQVPAARRPDVELRIARCLGLTQQWDAALAEGHAVAER